MADFPVDFYGPETIWLGSPESALQVLGLTAPFTSAAYPAANRAHYFPFVLPKAVLVRQLYVYNGATASGNVDMGIYDAGLNRLVSSGSVAQAGTSVPQFFNITDTSIGPGLVYLAIAMDGTVGTWLRASGQAYLGRYAGAFQQATAFPLPATATPAAYATTGIPWIGMVTGRML